MIKEIEKENAEPCTPAIKPTTTPSTHKKKWNPPESQLPPHRTHRKTRIPQPKNSLETLKFKSDFSKNVEPLQEKPTKSDPNPNVVNHNSNPNFNLNPPLKPQPPAHRNLK